MPDQRLERTRVTLPAGYQFPTPAHAHVHDDVAFDVVRRQTICQCGMRFNTHPTMQPQGRWFHLGEEDVAVEHPLRLFLAYDDNGL